MMFQRAKASAEVKKEMIVLVEDMINEEENPKEVSQWFW